MSERELAGLIGALREETRGVQAPARVEAALRSALRARRARRDRTRRWMLAAAGLVLLAGATAAWIGRDRAVQKIAVRKVTIPAPAIEAPQVVLPVAASAAKKAPPRLRKKPVQPPADEGEFLALDEASSLAPIESGQVVRVELPRTTLVRFGMPMNPDGMMEPVQADVVFGQDGIARAIRFVK